MSVGKTLVRLLLFAVLQFGAMFGGMKMTSEEIENLMNLMTRTKIVHVVKQDDD